jgi:protocatechuate 3,4-dioxygenase beta subunit
MDASKETNFPLPLTAEVEEGPYYIEGSPERRSVAAPGTNGSKLILEGCVLDVNGNAIPGPWLDFWQADGHGKYDNRAFNLRGHQFADGEGCYRLETVRPHEYLMRSPHLHAKVRASATAPILTTQLFFPGEKTNATDYLFEGRTLLDIKDIPGGQQARFDFVIATA